MGKILSEKKLDNYMEMTRAMAKNSPDKETQVGAVMLSADYRVIASSFNGFLRGAKDDSLPCTRPDKHKYIQHAERNMLYNCAYEGIRTKGTTIVCTLSPCLDCLRACFQSGVEIIYFDELYHRFPDTDFYKLLPDVFVFVGKTHESKRYTILQMIPMKDAIRNKWADSDGKRLIS